MSARGGAKRRAGRSGEEAGAVAGRLHSAAIALLRTVRREDDASGLSAPRLSALSVIVFGGSCTIGELAEAEQVRPPTMTRLVQALEADGLVRREPDPGDGRVVRVRETAKGRRLLLEGRRRRVAALADRLGALPAEELRLLGDASAVIEKMLGRPVPDPRRIGRG